MKKYICNMCGYVYDPAEGDPDNGVKAGTAFENLPDSWVCPLCGAPKDEFSPEESPAAASQALLNASNKKDRLSGLFYCLNPLNAEAFFSEEAGASQRIQFTKRACVKKSFALAGSLDFTEKGWNCDRKAKFFRFP